MLPADGAPNDRRRPLACEEVPCAPLSSEEIKSLHHAIALCLFCKNREEKIDLEASRFGFYPSLKLILMMSLMA